MAELDAKKDLVPRHGYDRLRGEVVAEAESRASEGFRRAEQAEARLREALLDDALPTLDPAREGLARQELALSFDGGEGAILGRVATIAEIARYQEHSARAGRREAARARRSAGLSRFLGPGRFDLDALTAPEFDRQRAVWEASGSTGLSTGGARQHRDVMSELRGDSA